MTTESVECNIRLYVPLSDVTVALPCAKHDTETSSTGLPSSSMTRPFRVKVCADIDKGITSDMIIKNSRFIQEITLWHRYYFVKGNKI